MTIRAMNWAWGIDLPPAMKLVLLKLADRANDNGECWPGIESVAAACGVSERTLIRHIDKMEAMDLLHKSKRKDESGRQVTNLYTLNLAYQPGDNLSPGDEDEDDSRVTNCHPVTDEPGDKSCNNRVTLVSPDKELKLFIETTDETTDATTKVAAPFAEPIDEKPVRMIDGRWLVDDAIVDRWVIAYQNGRTNQATEDWIEVELAKAALWLEANPRKRKKNLLRFLSGWLTRASSPSRSAYPPSSPQSRSPRRLQAYA